MIDSASCPTERGSTRLITQRANGGAIVDHGAPVRQSTCTQIIFGEETIEVSGERSSLTATGAVIASVNVDRLALCWLIAWRAGN